MVKVMKRRKDGGYEVVDRPLTKKMRKDDGNGKTDGGRLDDRRQVGSSDVQKIERPSTQNKGGPPVSPESPGSVMTKSGETGESGGSPRFSVDSKSLSDVKQIEKRVATEYLAGDDGRKVRVDVYDAGVEEVVRGDKVVTGRRLKFVLSYKGVAKECSTEEECKDAAGEIARATHYSVPKSAILELVSELRERYGDGRSVPLIEYVKERYPDRLAEITKDPFSWVLERTSHIVGYERLKLLTLLAVVTSRLRRVPGMSRLHLLLVGPSGAGKSSTVKSVLKFLSDDAVIGGTRLTQNALGYLNVDTLDGRVLFIEQVDRQSFNYVREAMTEDRICTVVTEKVVDLEGNERHVAGERCIPGQPVVISTSVVDRIDADREQLFNRFLKVYVDPRSVGTDSVVEAIMDRRPAEVDPADRLAFLAWLYSRPNEVSVSPEVVEEVKEFVRRLSELTREPVTRVTEVVRNLVVAVAAAGGKSVADKSDLEFVLDKFELDIMYNGLGLTERDVEFLSVLPDDGGLKTNDVADALRASRQYALDVLKELERKGLVEGVKEDGRTFTWYLTAFGKRVKSLLTDRGVVEDGDVIAEGSFRPPDDAGGDRRDDVSGPDRGGVPTGKGEAQGVSGGLLEAYRWLKDHGPALLTDVEFLFGAGVIGALKEKGLVTFNVVDGVEYVYPK